MWRISGVVMAYERRENNGVNNVCNNGGNMYLVAWHGGAHQSGSSMAILSVSAGEMASKRSESGK